MSIVTELLCRAYNLQQTLKGLYARHVTIQIEGCFVGVTCSVLNN